MSRRTIKRDPPPNIVRRDVTPELPAPRMVMGVPVYDAKTLPSAPTLSNPNFKYLRRPRSRYVIYVDDIWKIVAVDPISGMIAPWPTEREMNQWYDWYEQENTEETLKAMKGQGFSKDDFQKEYVARLEENRTKYPRSRAAREGIKIEHFPVPQPEEPIETKPGPGSGNRTHSKEILPLEKWLSVEQFHHIRAAEYQMGPRWSLEYDKECREKFAQWGFRVPKNFRNIQFGVRGGRKPQSGMSASLKFRPPQNPDLRQQFLDMGVNEKDGWMSYNRKDLVLSLHQNGGLFFNWNYRNR